MNLLKFLFCLFIFILPFGTLLLVFIVGIGLKYNINLLPTIKKLPIEKLYGNLLEMIRK